MPRRRVRVVCTLGVTIASFEPTSWFNSVDFPALGAPISATNPQRVAASLSRTAGEGLCGLFGLAFRAIRLGRSWQAQPLQQRGGGGGFSGALRRGPGRRLLLSPGADRHPANPGLGP